MPRHLRCLQGHQWAPTLDRAPTEEVCPVCGAPPEPALPAPLPDAFRAGPTLPWRAPDDEGIIHGAPDRPRKLSGGPLPSAGRDRGALGRARPSSLAPLLVAAILLPLAALVLLAGAAFWLFRSAGLPLPVAPASTWPASQGPALVLRGHVGEITSLVFTSGSTLAVASGLPQSRLTRGTGQIKLWDVSTGQGQPAVGDDHGLVKDLAVTADRKTLASVSADGTVQLWDLPVGMQRRLLGTRALEPDLLAITPDGGIVALGVGGGTYGGKLVPGEVVLWDVAADRERTRLKGHGGGINTLAFSPDGRLLASGSADRTVRLWDVTTGKEVATLRGHQDVVWAVTFSPDGTVVASGGGDGPVWLWNVATRDARAVLPGAPGSVGGVAFTPDGQRLAAGTGVFNAFGEVWLWDVPARQVTDILKGHPNYVRCLALSPDGKKLASVGGEKAVWVWDLPPGK